jgi:hypothetical protein
VRLRVSVYSNAVGNKNSNSSSNKKPDEKIRLLFFEA